MINSSQLLAVCFCQRSKFLRFKNYINGYIPQLWLNSPKMQEFINFNQVGQTRQALNFKQIRGIYFPLPPLQEQLEMVRIIKYEINKLDVVCNSLANLAVRIDTMKKSILAKAFRGELGTNNPTEDSALNLLKEVLQDKSWFAELPISLNIVNESRYVRVFFEIQPAVITTFALSDLMALSERAL